jgi:RHS repeat-associated protein
MTSMISIIFTFMLYITGGGSVPNRVDVVRLESRDSSLFIRFSEPINKEKAETAIKVNKGTIPISGSITFADYNQAAIFNCTTLPVNETLNITITTDLADEFGSQMPREFSQDFINIGSDLNIYDRAAPMVTKIRKIGPEFYITFNEEMSSTTTTGEVELTSAQGIFTGDCAADPEDAKTIRFTPGKALSIDVEYTVTVKSNTAADLSGKSLSEDFSRSFLNEGKDLFIYEKPDPNEHETSRVNNNCLFQGGIYHPELGLYYFRSRFYSPILGRFLQPDPMGYQDSFNLYEAFNKNPLTYVDPYGMARKKHGVNPNVTRSAYSRIMKYYRSRGMDRDLSSDQAMKVLVDLGYIEDKAQLKLGIAVTAQTGFFYNAMHYVTLQLFELSPAGIFKDAASLYFGKDLVYGTKLKWWNYAMVGVPILYETFKIGRGLGLADEFLDLGDFLTKARKLTVTAYRAQGRPLISIDELGNVKIARPLGRRNKGVAVHVGFDKKRARMWIKQKNRSQLIEFEVRESFLQKLRRTAQPEHGVIRDRTKPWRVDVKYPDQYAIPPSMLDEFEAAIVKGSGRIIHN